ncbi:RHS repeat-associated core domain-containing protein [Pseudomonas syringae pv. actinidifoliorum]|nr:RHS repeat-associated core domain-containing protein [Pseudomonas syringae pv. actinidifoliorum]MDU8520625.1 RHS repeat-associated core domain-containing protein [Pseudomonas syringae pv. actinidifoliorum]MDU8526152.1 RHS repeat-associated core domain-containing protein [Pseudomonas syringae pv. actinidifoliorum]
MASSNQAVLCRYSYDPLDRLASSSPTGQADIQRFYQKNRLATEIQGALRRTVFQHEDLLLAQQRRVDGVLETTLLATDQQRSVLQLVDNTGVESVAYSPYGHHPAESGLTSLLGFNGERRDPVTGYYLLGNGYRAYNPVLMRFNSPDSLSPFGEGGLNAYGYVGGDPVGFWDPSGHVPIKQVLKRLSRTPAVNRVPGKESKRIAKPVASTSGEPSSSSANASAPLPNQSPSSSVDVSPYKSFASSRKFLAYSSGVSDELMSSSLSQVMGKLSEPTYRKSMRNWIWTTVSTAVPKKYNPAKRRLNLHELRVKGGEAFVGFYTNQLRDAPDNVSNAAHIRRYENMLTEYRAAQVLYKNHYEIKFKGTIKRYEKNIK